MSQHFQRNIQESGIVAKEVRDSNIEAVYAKITNADTRLLKYFSSCCTFISYVFKIKPSRSVFVFLTKLSAKTAVLDFSVHLQAIQS